MTQIGNGIVPFKLKLESKRILTHVRRGQLPRVAQPLPIDPPIANPQIDNLRVEDQTPPLRQVPMEQSTLRDYAMPNLEEVQGSINCLAINANNFKIKLPMI